MFEFMLRPGEWSEVKALKIAEHKDIGGCTDHTRNFC